MILKPEDISGRYVAETGLLRVIVDPAEVRKARTEAQNAFCDRMAAMGTPVPAENKRKWWPLNPKHEEARST